MGSYTSKMSPEEKTEYIEKRHKTIFKCAVVFFIFALLSIFGFYDITLKNLALFDGKTSPVKVNSLTLASLGGAIAFISLCIAAIIGLIKKNPDSAKAEIRIMITGCSIMVFFLFFSSDILFCWANFHGYHVDHYEKARRGGWYIFKLNEAPVAPAIQSDPQMG